MMSPLETYYYDCGVYMLMEVVGEHDCSEHGSEEPNLQTWIECAHESNIPPSQVLLPSARASSANLHQNSAFQVRI